MFESVFGAAQTESGITAYSAVISIMAAVLFGIVIGVVYIFSCKKRCNKDFVIGLMLLPAIVSVVILLVGSNVARAFSMAGAFALVRFRSAPGSAKDIAIVFFSMAAGLACGLGFVSYAAVFVVVVSVFLLVLSLVFIPDRLEGKKQLKITIPENLNYTGVFEEVFEKYLSENALKSVKTTNMGSMFELTYHVKEKNETDEKAFIDELRTRNGNLSISLGMIPDGNQGVLN